LAAETKIEVITVYSIKVFGAENAYGQIGIGFVKWVLLLLISRLFFRAFN